MSDKALADELAAQAASRAAKEQKSADEASAAFEAIRSDRRMKRQASREISDCVKGAEGERAEKHAKLLCYPDVSRLTGEQRLYGALIEILFAFSGEHLNSRPE